MPKRYGSIPHVYDDVLKKEARERDSMLKGVTGFHDSQQHWKFPTLFSIETKKPRL